MKYIKIFTILLSIVFFETMLTTDSTASCTLTAGVYAASDFPNDDEGCETQPKFYEIIKIPLQFF